MIKLLWKDNPTAFSPTGGSVPTQEKRLRILGNQEMLGKSQI